MCVKVAIRIVERVCPRCRSFDSLQCEVHPYGIEVTQNNYPTDTDDTLQVRKKFNLMWRYCCQCWCERSWKSCKFTESEDLRPFIDSDVIYGLTSSLKNPRVIPYNSTWNSDKHFPIILSSSCYGEFIEGSTEVTSKLKQGAHDDALFVCEISNHANPGPATFQQHEIILQ